MIVTCGELLTVPAPKEHYRGGCVTLAGPGAGLGTQSTLFHLLTLSLMIPGLHLIHETKCFPLVLFLLGLTHQTNFWLLFEMK